jgi:hypothetical protein
VHSVVALIVCGVMSPIFLELDGLLHLARGGSDTADLIFPVLRAPEDEARRVASVELAPLKTQSSG